MALFGGEVRTIPYQAPDYSGSVAAARGQSMAGAQGIAGGISQVTDYFKQQGEKKKLIKQSDIQIDAALKLFPDLAPTLQGVRDQIKDENISLNERAGIAESVAGLINMGTNQMQAMAEYGLKKRQLDIQEGQGIQSALAEQAKLQAEANKPIKLKRSAIKLGDETEVDVLEDDYGNVYDPQTKSRILDVKKFAAGFPLSQVTEQFDASGLPVAYGGEMPTNTGGVLPDLEKGNVPTLSADAQAAADIGGAIYPDGVPVEGTPIAGAGDQITAASQIAAPVVPQASAEGVQTALDITSPQPQTLTPRARQIKKEGFREFTPEEVVKYGSPGQINTKNNEVKLLSPPVGRSWKVSPDGTVEVIEGVGVGGGKAGVAAEEAKKQSFERSRSIIGAASKVIPKIKSVLSVNPFVAAGQKALGDVLPATEVGRIASDLETVKVITSKEEVNNARAASPTGSAGGSITEAEWPKFENRFGKMNVGMNPNDLVSNVQKTALNQFESVNGTPEEVVKLFNNGKISKPVFDDYIKEYKQTRSILGIPDTGTGGPGDDWTKYNPNLLRFDKGKQSQLSPEAQAMQDRIDALKANQ